MVQRLLWRSFSQVSSAIPAEADITGDGEGWDLESSVQLGEHEKVGAKRHLRDFQDRCGMKK